MARRTLRLLSLLICIIMLALIFTGCSGEGNNTEFISSPTDGYTPRSLEPAELTLEQMQQIREDYLKKQGVENRKVDINGYYGTYDGAIAFFINLCWDSLEKRTQNVMVADCEFTYCFDWYISIYKDGDFLELSEAYESGWLTKEDVQDIHYYYSLDVPPEQTSPAKPSEKLITKIKKDKLALEKKQYEKAYPDKDRVWLIDDIVIDGYFGNYNGAVVIRFDGITHGTDRGCGNIAGYVFHYGSKRDLMVYKKGEFLHLLDAYKKGWLTKRDVREVQYYLNGI